jgi:hypothetical protein
VRIATSEKIRSQYKKYTYFVEITLTNININININISMGAILHGTTRFDGYAETAMLSAKAHLLSAHAVPRGNPRQTALGVARPAKI